jgi:paraquat-inducible protein A
MRVRIQRLAGLTQQFHARRAHRSSVFSRAARTVYSGAMANQFHSLRRAYPKNYVVPLALAAAAVLLTLGLYFPLLRIEKMLFWKNEYSVATGVFGLFEDGQYLLAAVVFFWSVVFPIGKLVLLFWLWFARTDADQRANVLRWLDKVGRWSMLDVYIVAVLVVALKLGPLASVTVEPGLYVFGSAVLVLMLLGSRMEKLAHRA